MRLIADCRLYGIVDLGYVKPEAVPGMTQALLEGGVEVLQLRAKKLNAHDVEALALRMLPFTRAAGVPLVINDHPEVAAAVGSEGVHIGQDDSSIAETREIVGPRCFIGRSTHSLAQARAAISEGADYIGFGPLFATGTKPDYTPIGLADIAEVQSFATVPVFCIGGINYETLPSVLAAGATRVVIVSAFLLAGDIKASVREVKLALARHAAPWKTGA
jgi:thiamine-phosphate pyrophosphorylase